MITCRAIHEVAGRREFHREFARVIVVTRQQSALSKTRRTWSPTGRYSDGCKEVSGVRRFRLRSFDVGAAAVSVREVVDPPFGAQ
jgi:hypothetical protein